MSRLISSRRSAALYPGRARGRVAGVEGLEPRRLLSSELVGNFGPTALSTHRDSVSDGMYAWYAAPGANVYDIWRTDGTAAGSRKLGSVPTGTQPRDFILAGGRLYFFASETESYAPELYTVNPATDQVVKISDFVPGGEYRGPRNLLELNGRAYAVGWGRDTGYELYTSDPGTLGTRLAVSLTPGAGDGVVGAWRAGAELYLAARNAAGGLAVYRSDGTQAGTRLVKQITDTGPEEQYAFLDGFVRVGSRVVFNQYTGFGDVLWSTDGTAAGTAPLNAPGGRQLTSAGDFAVYAGRDTAGDGAAEVFITDGTNAGTRAVRGLQLPDYFASSFVVAGGAAYVPSYGGPSGLYRVTPEETRRLIDGEVYQLYPVGDRVYFAGNYGGVTPIQHAVGVTDGTWDGTQLLEDRDPTVGGEIPTTFRRVRDGVIYGLEGRLYRLALDAPRLPGVSGHVFRDLNRNGRRDPGEGIEAFASVRANGSVNLPADGAGRYELRWMFPGSVSVSAESSRPYVRLTTPASRGYTLGEGQAVTDADFGFARINIVRGTVRLDVNLDDVAGFSEPGSGGHTVFADLDRDGTADPNEPSAVSAANGTYSLEDVPAGTVLVRVAPAPGWFNTAPVAPGREVDTSADGGVYAGNDFGVSQQPPRNYLGATLFDDTDRDGARDAGEPDAPPGLIWVDLDGDGAPDEGEPSHAAGGAAVLRVPGPGSYRVRFRPPTGWVATTSEPLVTVGPGERVYGLQLGAAVPAARGASLAGVAFVDTDGDGARDPGEPARAGARIYLDLDGDFAADEAEPSVLSDSLGRFAVVGLAPGRYSVRQVLRPDWQQTTPAPGEAVDVTLAAGEQRQDLLLGARAAAAADKAVVSGAVFLDEDLDGRRDAGEAAFDPLARVYVDLNNNGRIDAGEPDVRVTQDGRFAFTLAAGRYRLRIEPSAATPLAVSTFGAGGLVLDLSPGQATSVDVGLYRPAARVTAARFEPARRLPRVVLTLADLSNPGAVRDAVRVRGPGGQAVAPSRVAYLDNAWVLAVEFGQGLADGDYTLTIPGAALAGSGGLPTPPDYTFRFAVLSGDVNGDRAVNGSDFAILGANFGGTGKAYAQGDLDGDGSVNGADFAILAAGFGKSLPALEPPPAPLPTPAAPAPALAPAPAPVVATTDSTRKITTAPRRDVRPVKRRPRPGAANRLGASRD